MGFRHQPQHRETAPTASVSWDGVSPLPHWVERQGKDYRVII